MVRRKRSRRIMLVIRKKNEGVVINDDIAVTVVGIREDEVRLAIQTRKSATVHSREVYDAIHKVHEPDKLAWGQYAQRGIRPVDWVDEAVTADVLSVQKEQEQGE